MFWRIGGIDGNVSNIVASKGLDTFIDIGSTIMVAMETDIAEVCLHKTRLQIGDTDGGVGHIDTQSIGKCLYCGLRGTIHIAPCVCGIASNRTHIDNVSAIALHHTWYNEPRHGQQTFDVGINHGLPIVEIAFVFWLQSKSQPCIVHQHIDLLPLCRQRLDAFLSHFAISHVEGQGQHVSTFSRQFLLDVGQPLLVSTGKNQPVTVLGEFPGTSQSDTACCPCYQYNLVHNRLNYYGCKVMNCFSNRQILAISKFYPIGDIRE